MKSIRKEMEKVKRIEKSEKNVVKEQRKRKK